MQSELYEQVIELNIEKRAELWAFSSFRTALKMKRDVNSICLPQRIGVMFVAVILDGAGGTLKNIVSYRMRTRCPTLKLQEFR